MVNEVNKTIPQKQLTGAVTCSGNESIRFPFSFGGIP